MNPHPTSPASRGSWLGYVVVALALVAVGINGWLAWAHFTGGTVAGCGGGGCEAVAASRWSMLFAVVPVALCGGLAWLFLLVSVTVRRWGAALAAAGVAVGAAVWFVFVQAVILGRFCRWCMAAHLLGAVVGVMLLWMNSRITPDEPKWRRFGAWAWAALLVIGLSQVYGPVPATHEMGEIAAADAAPVHERGSGPKARFANGAKIYDVAALPHLGPVTARKVLVEYFDYTCAACQTMHTFIEALREKHPDYICVVVLPVPLGRACNPALGPNETDHPGACETSRLALALWRSNPAVYQEMHGRMMHAESPAAVRSMVLERISQTDLDRAMADPWIDALLAANIRDWRRFSDRVSTLPKLLVSDRRIVHGLPSGQEDFIRVMERELGL